MRPYLKNQVSHRWNSFDHSPCKADPFIACYLLGGPVSTAKGLGEGEVDLNWQYVFGNTSGSVLVGGAGEAWKQFSENANWVSSPLINGYHAPGQYIFTTQFTLGNDFTDYSLNGQIAADNMITNVLINGVEVPFDSETSYTYTTPFKFAGDSMFRGGVNTVEFQVTNLPYIPRKWCRSGIYVEFL